MRLGFVVSGLIAVLIVTSVIILSVIAAFYGPDVKIPSVLENWGGVVVGFYFGTFVSLIKDYMGLKSTSNGSTGTVSGQYKRLARPLRL